MSTSGAGPGLPVDPDVKLPAALRAQMARADEIHKAAYTPPQQDQQQPPPTAAQPPPAAAQPPPAAAQPPPAAAQPPPAAQPPAAAQPELDELGLPKDAKVPGAGDDWQHKYNSLAGRMRVTAEENARLQADLRRTNDRLTALETAQRTAPPAAAQPVPPRSSLTDAERTEYTPEFLDVVGRHTQDVVKPLIDQAVNQAVSTIKGEIAKTTKPVQDAVAAATQAESRRLHEAKITVLTNEVPNWRVINKHPKFLEWLSLTDPLAGATRKALLDDANRRNDGPRVATFFKQFLTDMKLPVPQAQGTSPGNGAKVDLTAQAAPGKPAGQSGAPPPPAPEKRIITSADIAEFNRLKQHRLLTPQQIAENEAELALALREGRVRK